MYKHFYTIGRFVDGLHADVDYRARVLCLNDATGAVRIGTMGKARPGNFAFRDVTTMKTLEFQGDEVNLDFGIFPHQSFRFYPTIEWLGILHDPFNNYPQRETLVRNAIYPFVAYELLTTAVGIEACGGKYLQPSFPTKLAKEEWSSKIHNLLELSIIYTNTLEKTYGELNANLDMTLFARYTPIVAEALLPCSALSGPETLEEFLKQPEIAMYIKGCSVGGRELTPINLLDYLTGDGRPEEGIPREILEAHYQQFREEVGSGAMLHILRERVDHEYGGMDGVRDRATKVEEDSVFVPLVGVYSLDAARNRLREVGGGLPGYH